MARVAWSARLRPDKIDEYVKEHAAVWPDMLQALRDTGWQNYSLFLREDGLLIGYLETPDFEAAKAGMQNKEVNKRWQDDMAPFFESLDGGHADEAMMNLEEVFHLD